MRVLEEITFLMTTKQLYFVKVCLRKTRLKKKTKKLCIFTHLVSPLWKFLRPIF